MTTDLRSEITMSRRSELIPSLDQAVSVAPDRTIRVIVDPGHAGRPLVVLDGPGVSGAILFDELLAITGVAQRHIQQGTQVRPTH